MPIKRAHLCIGLLVVASCTIGSLRTILTSADVASATAAATNTDADLLFVGSANGQLVQADPATGSVTNAITLWGGTNSNVLAITPDGEDPSQVWSLHADGWAVNWSSGPSMEGFFAVPSFGPSSTPCDIDQAMDGDFYHALLDGNTAWLGRRDATTQSWNWSVVPGGGCPRIAHDLYHDVLYVLRGNGFTLERRDADTLAVQSSALLDVDDAANGMDDVDVFGNVAVGVGTIPFGAGIKRMAWHFHPQTGDPIDSQTFVTGPPSSTHITVNAASSTGEMIVAATGGVNTVRGLLLLD